MGCSPHTRCDTRRPDFEFRQPFVIEGYVDPREPLRDEGPFGDHTGCFPRPAGDSERSRILFYFPGCTGWVQAFSQSPLATAFFFGLEEMTQART
jgi:hypothetical protein